MATGMHLRQESRHRLLISQSRRTMYVSFDLRHPGRSNIHLFDFPSLVATFRFLSYSSLVQHVSFHCSVARALLSDFTDQLVSAETSSARPPDRFMPIWRTPVLPSRAKPSPSLQHSSRQQESEQIHPRPQER